MKTIRYREDIDALRGISVLLVVLFHTFPKIIPGGFIGVDVFFVISGYLITQIIFISIKKNDFSIIEFYKRRIRRLFPSLATVLLFSMLIGWLILFPDEYKQLAHHVKYSAMYLLNFLLIDEVGYFDVASTYKPLLHLWTLSVEEQFYVFWPIILLASLKQNTINPALIIVIIILLSFIGNIYFIVNNPEGVYYHTLTRAWQLAFGSLLSIILLNNKTYYFLDSRILSLIGMATIIITALMITGDIYYPGWVALLPTIGAIAVIIANAKFNTLLWKVMVSIGLISYPLYLWHWVLISFATIYLGKDPHNIAMLMLMALAFGLSYLTYRYIEKIRFSNNRYVPGILLSVIAIIGLTGWHIQTQNGFPDRGHLDYLKRLNMEFVRTPATDTYCKNYTKRFINESKFYYCRANDTLEDDKNIIALIGDSHAHAIYPGIAEQADINGYNTVLMANTGCPTMLGFLSGNNPKEIDLCQNNIEQIISNIESDKRIKKVIIATRGPRYIHGEVTGKFTEQTVKDSLDTIYNEKLTYETYFNGFRTTLKRINNANHIEDIYFIWETPELDFLPKEVIRRPFDKWGLSTQGDTINKALYLQRMEKYRSMSLLSIKNYMKTKAIDPTPYLCGESECYSYLDGNFLYADYHHFSVFGSQYLAKKLSKVIFYD